MSDACCSHGLLTRSLAVSDPQVIEILDEYLARIEAGEPPNVDELIARSPELADELRAYFDSIDFLRQAAVATGASLLEDWSGRSLGDYNILREIGRGGMGIVYEAKQTSLDRRAWMLLRKSEIDDQPCPSRAGQATDSSNWSFRSSSTLAIHSARARSGRNFQMPTSIVLP